MAAEGWRVEAGRVPPTGPVLAPARVQTQVLTAGADGWASAEQPVRPYGSDRGQRGIEVSAHNQH